MATSPVTTTAFWDDAHELYGNIPSDHKNFLGCCAPKYLAPHPQQPQQSSKMLHTNLYTTTSPLTRTFRDAAQNTIWHHIPNDHNLQVFSSIKKPVNLNCGKHILIMLNI
jgi:hypothetical protein